MKLTDKDIIRALHNSNPRPHNSQHVVTLGKGDTAWNPASTKHVIGGPATVTYFLYPDGGIDVVVRAAETERHA